MKIRKEFMEKLPKPAQSFTNELKKLKSMSGYQALIYLWDYYKVPFGFALMILFVFTIILSALFYKSKGPVFSCAIINTGSNSDLHKKPSSHLREQDFQDLISFNPDLPLNIQYIEMNTVNGSLDYTVLTKLTAQAASYNLDIIIAPPELISYYGELGGLLDLREIFSEENFDIIQDNLFYTTNPDTQEDFPCGVVLDSKLFMEKTGIRHNQPVFAVIGTSPHSQLGVQLLNDLMSQ